MVVAERLEAFYALPTCREVIFARSQRGHGKPPVIVSTPSPVEMEFSCRWVVTVTDEGMPTVKTEASHDKGFAFVQLIVDQCLPFLFCLTLRIGYLQTPIVVEIFLQGYCCTLQVRTRYSHIIVHLHRLSTIAHQLRNGSPALLRGGFAIGHGIPIKRCQCVECSYGESSRYSGVFWKDGGATPIVAQ